MDRIDIVAGGDRQDQRNHQHQGGKNIEHGADDQQKDIEQQQKSVFRIDVGVDYREELGRDLLINQIIGGGHRDGKDHQNSTEQGH